MTKARWTIRSAVLFGLVTGSVSMDARPAAAGQPTAPAKPTATTTPAKPTATTTPAKPTATKSPIQWKLWVGKKAYGLRPQGGPAPLPQGTQWRCRYSEPSLEKSKGNLKEETVTLLCWVGSVQFNLSTTCSYPMDPRKGVEGGVMPSDFQNAFLGGRTFVGVSCDVPGYELRTYRKK